MNEPLTDRQRAVLRAQLRNELTEAAVYSRLAEIRGQDPANRDILRAIAGDERRHAAVIKSILNEDAAPRPHAVLAFTLTARIFGLTFAIKLMERGEDLASALYRDLSAIHPTLARLAEDEELHERQLQHMLTDGRLQNIGAIVLGLNDALVELTGALAGYTFALRHPRTIAMTGLITGLAAAMSMAASSYLSARTEGRGSPGQARKTAAYTGVTYAATVLLLILPYLLLPGVTLALGVMLAVAIGIIAFFNFYLSVAKDIPFRRSFLEMAGISATVAAISFGIGYLLNHAFGA